MFYLKRKVTNKARVEEHISEAYILVLPSYISSDGGDKDSSKCLAIFAHPCRLFVRP